MERDELRLPHKNGELDLGRRAGATELECRELIGIDLAHVTKVNVTQQEPGSATGCEQCHLDRLSSQGRGNVQSREERLDHAFDLPEVAATDQGQPGRLVGEGLVRAWKINMGNLEQLGIEVAVGLVVPANRQQAGNQALPQRDLPFAAGMLDPERRRSGARAARAG